MRVQAEGMVRLDGVYEVVGFNMEILSDDARNK